MGFRILAVHKSARTAQNLLCSSVLTNDIQKALRTNKYLKTFQTVSCYSPKSPQVESLRTHVGGGSGAMDSGVCGATLQKTLTGIPEAFPSCILSKKYIAM